MLTLVDPVCMRLLEKKKLRFAEAPPPEPPPVAPTRRPSVPSASPSSSRADRASRPGRRARDGHEEAGARGCSGSHRWGEGKREPFSIRSLSGK